MKHGENRRSVSSKTFVVMLALVLALGCAVGGTIAWLTANTDPVVNTFTYGNINIELNETKPANRQATIIPGKNIEKDPTVKVVGGSEACWLFVKVDEENWPAFADTNGAKKVSYDIADGWKPLAGHDGVYWREVGAVTADTTFDVLKGNIVTVSNTLTKDEIKNAEAPKLTFTAYAVQKENVADAAAAWDLVKPATPVAP